VVKKDYTRLVGISSSSQSHDGVGKNREQEKSKPRGRYWKLPKVTCAICHDRMRKGVDKTVGLPFVDLDVDRDESESGSDSELEPDIEEDTEKQDLDQDKNSSPSPSGRDLDSEDILAKRKSLQQDVNEETRIHMPTRAGCSSQCVYCYYCIAQALTVQARLEEQKADEEVRGRGENGKEKEEGKGIDSEKSGWSCLRCGEKVKSCERITSS